MRNCRLLHELRCSPGKTSHLIKAIAVLQTVRPPQDEKTQGAHGMYTLRAPTQLEPSRTMFNTP